MRSYSIKKVLLDMTIRMSMMVIFVICVVKRNVEIKHGGGMLNDTKSHYQQNNNVARTIHGIEQWVTM